jgi:Protein of unknown function (DUF1064)
VNKYHAQAVQIDGIRFHSKKEAHRYGELLLLQRAGLIHNLQLQPRFDIIINHRKIGFYKADFRYISQDGQTHIEDAKGVSTAVYRLKKRIVEAMYGVTIEEV